MLTTNRPITAWGDILGDTTVAAALLDRLLHRSVVLDINGDSYRLRNHNARMGHNHWLALKRTRRNSSGGVIAEARRWP